jgi:hypothetical protein
LVETKASTSDFNSDFDSEPKKGKWIIDIEPYVTMATKNVQLEELEEPEEGESLFRSWMWLMIRVCKVCM